MHLRDYNCIHTYNIQGFPALNPQRFGAHFVGELANPATALLFAKKRKGEGAGRATEGRLSGRTHVGKGLSATDVEAILAEGGEELSKVSS
jgi:hypothetical protein